MYILKSSLVFGAGAWVWLQLAAVEGGVSESSIVRQIIHPPPHTALETDL